MPAESFSDIGKIMSRSTYFKEYRILVKPVVKCCCETWIWSDRRKEE
jgi:hypothetical protein